LLHCPGKKRVGQLYPKWRRLFSAEATVVKRINEVTYLVQLVRSHQRKIVHVDRMRLLRRCNAVDSDVDSSTVNA
jgi:hypothetical protein